MTQFTASEVRANAAFRRKEEPELAAMLYAFADMLEAQEKAGFVVIERGALNRMLTTQERAMDKQFSASEVRRLSNRIPRSNDEIADAQEALRAFADMLEAQEKAMPVAWCRFLVADESGPEGFDPGDIIDLDIHPHAERPEGNGWQAMFLDATHPAPSDAERLAEALRQIAVTTKGYPNASREGEIAIKALAAHSAQAQPHDLIKTGDPDVAPSICDANGEVVLAYCRKCKQGEGDLAESCPAQPPAASVTDAPVPVFSWQPIETAPKNNKRPLFLARFNDDGSLQSFDYDASWMSESESWEIPEVYFFWASANGNVEEPTHWAYQPAGFDKIEAALAAQENPNG